MFFLFTVNNNDNMKDLLQNVIKFHIYRKFPEQKIHMLLMNHESIINIASNEKWKADIKIYLLMNSFCTSLQLSQKYCVVFNFLMKVQINKTSLR